MQSFEHVAVTSAREAIAALADGERRAQIVAGGTDLLPLLNAGLIAPRRLIDVSRADELRYLHFGDDGSLRLGALATLAEVERSAEAQRRLPLLVQAVREAATPQLRNMASVGGNLLQRPRCWYFRGGHACWLSGGTECFAREGENAYHAVFDQGPCVAAHPSDLAPALIALDATVLLDGASGARSLPVGDFLQPASDPRRTEHVLRADELLTAIQVPAQPDGARGVYLKVMERQAWAFALVSVAVVLAVREGSVEHARVVLGGVANTPVRARIAETALVGQPFTGERAAQAAELALADARPLRQNAYKVAIARALLRRALIQCSGLDG
jgi:xanthine dehydrogenase YagS FAD-binding subunit